MSGPGDRANELVPKGPVLLDMTMVVVLGTVSMYGFRDTFADSTYLVAGVLGLVLGSLVAHVALVLRQPAVVAAVFTIAAFFLLGGAVALHGGDGLDALPVPHTLSLLADQSVHGWKELLTTLPPVDSGPLLTLPYLLGLVAGAAAVTVARRLRVPVAPVLVVLALLSTVILLGVHTPGSVVALGSVFGILALGWSVARARRLARTTRFERRLLRKRLVATALCACAGGLAVVAGPSLPGMGADRVVLRSHVTPPFDVGQYPSPLASFRRYTDGVTDGSSLKDVPLVKVSGVKPGTLVRFAALDAYDGTVWGAANDAGTEPGNADTYQKVGSTVTNPMLGRPVHATVELESGYSGVWLPTIGGLEHIDFTSSGLRGTADDFRYNLATSTGVMPDGLHAGERYRIDAVEPASRVLHADSPMSGSPLVASPSAALFQPDAVRWAGGADTPMAQVLAVASHLKSTGTFTHGGTGEEEYEAGHSVKRLKEFVSPTEEPAGDDEQYAATMALMANDLGVPARVVVGAALPGSGVIKGSDVHAWVELRAQDGSWQTLATGQFMSTDKPPLQHKQKDPTLAPGITVPPPVPVRPPATVGDPAPDAQSRHAKEKHSPWDLTIPWYVVAAAKYVGVPLLLVAAVLLGIVLAKRRRRVRRRTRGTPARRLAAAYRELLDHARDLGHRVHAGRTRREQAGDIGVEQFLVMARTADAHVFGAAEPTDEVAEAYWSDVDELRSHLTRSLTRWGRIKAAASLRSFTPLRRRGVEA